MESYISDYESMKGLSSVGSYGNKGTLGLGNSRCFRLYLNLGIGCLISYNWRDAEGVKDYNQFGSGKLKRSLFIWDS